MNIRSSYIMNQHLRELGYNFLNESIQLPKYLELRVNEKISIEKDLVFLGKISKKLTNYTKSDDYHKINIEMSINDTSIVEYLTNASDLKKIEFLGLGLEFIKRLAKRLKNEYPENSFSVIMEYSSIVDGFDHTELEACNAYFFKIRNSYDFFTKQIEWYDDKDYTIGMLEIKI